MSSYPPVWVKQDTRRFPRVILHNNEANILSTIAGFSDATRDADARAFATLMQHIRDVDSRDHTVIMMQAENEVGILGDARDHSGAADQAFAAAVPSQLIEYTSRPIATPSIPNFALSGCKRVRRVPAPGRKYLATLRAPMRSLWPGTMLVMSRP